MTTRRAVAISWVTGKSLPGSGGRPAALLAAPASQRVPLRSHRLEGTPGCHRSQLLAQSRPGGSRKYNLRSESYANIWLISCPWHCMEIKRDSYWEQTTKLGEGCLTHTALPSCWSLGPWDATAAWRNMVLGMLREGRATRWGQDVMRFLGEPTEM